MKFKAILITFVTIILTLIFFFYKTNYFNVNSLLSNLNNINLNKKTEKISEQDKELLETAQAIFTPLPKQANNKDNIITKEKVELGKSLFFETRLSKGNTISCNSCHNIANYGVDNLPTSQGHKGVFGLRNAPSVFNSALNESQFWDGRAKDVEEQAKGPIFNPIEMAMPHENVVLDTIESIPQYKKMFKKAFPNDKNPVSIHNLQLAIGAFERYALLTPSKFDEFLKGNTDALNQQEKIGLNLFINKGCISCHQGINIGGSQFQKFGLANEPYWEYTKSKRHDKGIFEITKNKDDEYYFKVPSLRNVERTYPYFHDGSVWKLKDAIKIMGKTQLDIDLTDTEIKDIETFLNTLTGQISDNVRTLPQLPKSTDTTPLPVNQ